jgi:DNA mismatch repair protein MutL
VYIEIDPALADFNIHPAKREARFKDSGSIHHAITSSLKNFMHHYGVHEELSSIKKNNSYGNSLHFDFALDKKNNFSESKKNDSSFYDDDTKKSLMEEFLDRQYDFISPPRKIQAHQAEYAAETASYNASSLTYRGRIFDLFILVEKDETLYIVDQHAAHERILFNRLVKGPILKQELLAPITFETESDEDDAFLENRKEEFANLGLVISKNVKNSWQIEALPANWKLNDQKTVEEILKLRTSREDITRSWAATIACHAAIKDGDYLDADTALSLAEEALALPEPYCPHGRPLWTEMNLESLLKAVKRT